MKTPKPAEVKPLPSTPTQASYVSRGSSADTLLPSTSSLTGLAKARTNKPSLVGGRV